MKIVLKDNGIYVLGKDFDLLAIGDYFVLVWESDVKIGFWQKVKFIYMVLKRRKQNAESII